MILVKCVEVFPDNARVKLGEIYYGIEFRDGKWSIYGLSKSYKDFLGIFYNHQFITIEEYRNNQLNKLKIL